MPFSEIVGQDHAITPLRSALRRGTLHHAYLFAGQEGVGKGTAARLLAQAANCDAQHDDSPCGECAPCRKIARGNHPDVLFLSEERAMAKAGRWESKSGRAPSKEIVVDQVRDLVDHRLSMKRFEGRRRFVVIDPADAMNPQAQNALLKTLEEPPDETTLVLIAARPDALLSTVRSRCQRVTFAPLPPSVVEGRLTAAGRSPEEARLAAALAAGSLGRALALDRAALTERRTAIEKIARLGPDDARDWITFAREYGSGRDTAREICELVLVWLRDVLALVVAGERAPLALGDLASLAHETAGKLDAVGVLHRRGRVEQALAALRHNASAALALERMFIGWFHG